MAQRAQQLRVSAGLSQADLAQRAGVDRSTVRKLEHGMQVAERSLHAIATALLTTTQLLRYGQSGRPLDFPWRDLRANIASQQSPSATQEAMEIVLLNVIDQASAQGGYGASRQLPIPKSLLPPGAPDTIAMVEFSPALSAIVDTSASLADGQTYALDWRSSLVYAQVLYTAGGYMVRRPDGDTEMDRATFEHDVRIVGRVLATISYSL